MWCRWCGPATALLIPPRAPARSSSSLRSGSVAPDQTADAEPRIHSRHELAGLQRRLCADAGRSGRPLRVALVGATRDLRHEVVRAMIAAEPDLELTLDLRTSAWLAQAAVTEEPDVVISFETDLPPAHAFAEVLRARPSLRVIAVDTASERAAVFELTPSRRDVSDLSGDVLLTLIRGGEGRSTEDGSLPDDSGPAAAASESQGERS